MLIKICALFIITLFLETNALENGLARTPPMGWMSWQRFRCVTDCVNYPEDCISDKLFRSMADHLVSEGYADVGYEYIIIDDCWLERERDANGRLQPDASRFPYGLLDLSNYIHSKGLKFGLYEDYGNYTCAGYPGVLGHLEEDAKSFAEWEVDYVKLDGCYAKLEDMDIGYPAFGRYLNQTGRPMVYSCSWPVYQNFSGMQPNYTAIIETCNLWRNYGDIQDSWDDVQSIIEFYARTQDEIVAYAGPGHWNDPDMLIIGDFGLSKEQSKSQMALWAIMASPLIMSNDLRAVDSDLKAILQNRKVIAVNQDPLGIQGRRISKVNNIDVWVRPISPVVDGKYTYAVAIMSRRTDGIPFRVSVKIADLGMDNEAGYDFQELFDDQSMGVLKPSDSLTVKVNPSGVKLFKADIVTTKYNDEMRPHVTHFFA